MPSSSGLGGVFEELISPTKYPKVPAAPNVNPQAAQLRTTQGNLEALPGLENLGSQVNAYNLAQRKGQLAQAIPGFEGLVSAGSANMSDWLHGVLSPDVSSAVERGSVARSIGGGYGGSGAAANLTARDLGLTSLDLQQKATGALPGYLGGLASIITPKPFDVTSGMLTPGQDITAEQWNEMNRYRQQGLQAEIDALPDPLMKAVGSFVGGLTNDVVNAAEAYFSGGMVSGIGTGGGGGAGAIAGQNLFGNQSSLQSGGFTMQNYQQMIDSGNLPSSPSPFAYGSAQVWPF